MKNIKVTALFYWLSAVFYLLNAAMLLVMPFVPLFPIAANRKYTLIVGLTFWITLALAIAAIVLAIISRRKFKKANPKAYNASDCRWGVITFFSNVIAIIFDLMFVVAAFALCIMLMLGRFKGYFAFVVLFMLVLSLSMHCLFNGRVFKTIKHNI